MKLYLLLYIIYYFTLYCCVKGYDEINNHDDNISKLQMKLLKLSKEKKDVEIELDILLQNTKILTKNKDNIINDKIVANNLLNNYYHYYNDNEDNNIKMNQKDQLDLKYKLYSLLANETTFDPTADPTFAPTSLTAIPTFAPTVDPTLSPTITTVPFYCPEYSVTNTSNANQNYAICLVYACAGETLVISGCGEGNCTINI